MGSAQLTAFVNPPDPFQATGSYTIQLDFYTIASVPGFFVKSVNVAVTSSTHGVTNPRTVFATGSDGYTMETGLNHPYYMPFMPFPQTMSIRTFVDDSSSGWYSKTASLSVTDQFTYTLTS
jgi:hypothetical protein